MSSSPVTSTLGAVSTAVAKVTELALALMQANSALTTALMIHAATLKDAPPPGPPPPPDVPRSQQTS